MMSRDGVPGVNQVRIRIEQFSQTLEVRDFARFEDVERWIAQG